MLRGKLPFLYIVLNEIFRKAYPESFPEFTMFGVKMKGIVDSILQALRRKTTVTRMALSARENLFIFRFSRAV
jgi:hypothetical protein